MTGKQLLLKALKDRGVKYIFGYIGGAIMPVFDEMEKGKTFNLLWLVMNRGQRLWPRGCRGHQCRTESGRSGSVSRRPVLER